MRKLNRSMWMALAWLLLLWVGLPYAAWAAPLQQTGDTGLLVQGAIVNITMKPGQTYVHNMIVGSGAQAPAMDIQITANGFGESLSGSFRPVAADQDQSPYSARTFITAIDKPGFHLDPGGRVPVAVTIVAPPDLGTNTRYALIFIHSSPLSANNGVGQILAASIPVIITPEGAQLNRTGQIKDVTVRPVVTGQPIQVSTTVVNTGNRHYKVQGEVTLKDPSGQVVATLPILLSTTPIIPAFAEQLTVSYSALDRPQGLAAGTYSANVQVNFEDGRPLGTRQASFQVTQPYQLCADVDASHAIMARFTNETPGVVRGQGKTDIDLTLQNTGVITGYAAICQFSREPSGTPTFEAGLDNGGTGATGLKFARIGVEGFNQGIAQVAVHYQTAELGSVEPNSLFLAYRDGGTWLKLNNLTVQTGASVVMGELPVAALTQGQLVALGGGALAAAPTAAQVADAADLSSYWPLFGVAIVLAVILIGAVILVARRLGRGQGAST